MDTPENQEKPKKKQSLAVLGGMLILGGVIVLSQAGKTERFYQNIHEEGDASWAQGLGWVLILGGGGLLLTGLVKQLGKND